MKDKVLGITFLVAGLVVISFIIGLPSARSSTQILETAEAQALVKNGVPTAVIESYGTTHAVPVGVKKHIPAEVDMVALAPESEWTIYFGKRKTLGGQWRGEEPTLSILEQAVGSESGSGQKVRCLTEGTLQGNTRTKKWSSIRTHSNESIYPKFTVKVPYPYVDCLHATIKVRANLRLIFPSLSGRGYANITSNLGRSFELFVITEEESSSLDELYPRYRISLAFRLLFIAISGLFFGLSSMIFLEII